MIVYVDIKHIQTCIHRERENTYMENWKIFFELKCTTRVCYNVEKVMEFSGGDDFLKCIHVYSIILYFKFRLFE